jgi:hypothetical protein
VSYTQSSNGSGILAADEPENNPFLFYMWGAEGKQMKLHMVPKGWRLPTMNIKDIWNLWWHGHCHDKIQPYRFLTWQDLSNDAQVAQLCRTKKVMNTIEGIARDKRYIEEAKAINELIGEERGTLFDSAFTDLMELLKPGSTREEHNRLGDSSIGTIYNQLVQLRKRKRDAEAIAE